MNLKLEVEIPIERVRELLCGALEGGSNYWCGNLNVPKASRDLDPPIERGADGSHTAWPVLYIAATTEGHHITLEEIGEGDEPPVKHRLSLGEIRKGLLVMAAKYPKHFGDFMGENDDADTADVFLQCCLLGEVVYG